MTWLKQHSAHLWILLAALAATTPLLWQGPSCGHDFNFHLANWMETQRQWSHGVLLPRWSFPSAWGAGEPRFLFYPPLSWMLGALCGTLVPWTLAPALFTFLAFALNGLTMFRLAREYVSQASAIVDACFFIANPYMLFTAYERTAYAELLAAAWMPLLLREALRPQIRIAGLALPVALLWLTNAPAAVVGCYSLLVIVAVRYLMTALRRQAGAMQLALRATAGCVLGGVMAAVYLLPVLVQRKWVQINMVVVEGMRPWDNYLYGRTHDPLHDTVLHTASTVVLMLLCGALVCLAVLWLRRDNETKASLLPLTILIAVIALLLTPFSNAIWKHAPQLMYLQFPWRFAAIAGAATALLLAFTLRAVRHRKVLFSLTAVCVAVLVVTASHKLHQFCDDEDNPAAARRAFLSGNGVEPTDEYTPQDADNDSLARYNPRAWLAANAGRAPGKSSAPDVIAVTSSNPYELRFFPQGNAPWLIVNLRRFHGWHAFVDGAEVHSDTTRDDGLWAIPIHSGHSSQVQVVYRWTWDEWLGLALSGISWLFWFATRQPAAKAIK